MFGVKCGWSNASMCMTWLWREGAKLYVDGGGVQAEVISHVLASNGVIHTIDRVTEPLLLCSYINPYPRYLVYHSRISFRRWQLTT